MSDVYAWRDPFVEVAEARAAQQRAERDYAELKTQRGVDLKPYLKDAFADFMREVVKFSAQKVASQVVYDRIKDAHDAVTSMQFIQRVEREMAGMDQLSASVTMQVANGCTFTLSPKLGTYVAVLEIKSIGPIDMSYEIDWREIEMRARHK